MSRIVRLTKEFMWVGVGQVIAVLGSLVGVRVLTDILSPGIYGEVALILTFATLAQQVFLGPCVSTLTRFYAPAKEAGQIGSYYSAGFQLIKKASIYVVLSMAGLILGLWVCGYAKYMFFILGAFVFAMLSGYSAAMDGIQNAARQRIIVAWHQGLSQWLRFAAVILIVGWLGVSSTTALWGYILGVAIVLISQGLLLAKLVRSDCQLGEAATSLATESHFQKMYSYAWPFVVWGILGWVQFSADRWALQVGSTAREVGFYAVLYQLGVSPMLMLSGVLLQLVAPILFQRVGAGTDSSRVRKMLELNQRLCYCSLGITAVGFGLTLLLHRQIFSWLVAPTYRSVSYLLPWMALSGGLFASAQLATLSLLSESTSRVLLAPKIGCAVLAAALYFASVWHYGLGGVVAAGLLVSVVYLVWVFQLVSLKKASLP